MPTTLPITRRPYHPAATRRPFFRPLRLPPTWFCFTLLASALPAQIQILSFGSPVTENFDSLGTSSTATLPPFWRMTPAGEGAVTWDDARNSTTTTAQASSGSPTTGGRYNWGQSSTDRAPGFMTSSGYASPNNLLARFTNATGSPIDALSVAFDYERYRLNTTPASITFFTSLDGTLWTEAAAGASGPFSTGASAYAFATPLSTSSHQVHLAGLGLLPGDDLFLRWHFHTGGANSQGLALDNFSLTATAVPEPSTYAALGGAAALALAAWRRRQRPPPPQPE